MYLVYSLVLTIIFTAINNYCYGECFKCLAVLTKSTECDV